MAVKPLTTLVATALVAAIGTAGAETPDQFSGIKRQLAAEQQAIQSAELKRLIEIERKKLTEGLKRLEELEARVAELDGGKPQPRQAAQTQQTRPAAAPAQRPQQTAQAQPQSVAQQREAAAEDRRERSAQAVQATSQEVAGILTPKGTLTLEPSLKYVQSSTNRIYLEGFGPLILPSFFLGIIDIREVDRKTAVASLSARYGINNRLQISGRVPYVWRDDSTRTQPISVDLVADDIFTADGAAIGDIEAAIDYQFNDGDDGWPFITGSLRVKAPTGTNPYEVETAERSLVDDDGNCQVEGVDPAECIQTFPKELPTGTGTWSIQPSVTFLYPTDPAVFYGTLDYSFNLDEDFRDVGNIDPGDAIGISGGMGFGINDRSSFSVGFSYTHGFETKQNGSEINGSDYDIGRMLFGYSFRWSQDTTVNLTVGIGATEDAQDFEMNLSIPTNFVL
jgi:hypothetical protein